MLTALLGAIAFAGGRAAGTPIWGVTIDDLANLDQIIPALGSLRKKPTARIVFDPSTGPGYYLPALEQLHAVTGIMGEPIDSAPPSGQLSVSGYVSRMSEYMSQLTGHVDIWEIGNEVNGGWTCASTEMAQKIEGTFAVAQTMGVQTALTLFYSPYYLGTDREMVAWSQSNLSAAVRNGIDYVLVSYYPTSLAGGPHWPEIFRQLGATFPNAKVGFGELGLATPSGNLSVNQAGKAQLIRKLYTAGSLCPGRYIGGFFWWAFAEDAVPARTGLWNTFYQVIH